MYFWELTVYCIPGGVLCIVYRVLTVWEQAVLALWAVSSQKHCYTAFVPRPSHHLFFDHLQYATAHSWNWHGMCLSHVQHAYCKWSKTGQWEGQVTRLMVSSIFSGTLIHWLSHCSISDLLAVCKHGHVNLMSANMKVMKCGEVQRTLRSFVVMVSVQGVQCETFTKLKKYSGMKKMCVERYMVCIKGV